MDTPYSKSYLAYGITIATESLLYGVKAWPKLQGPLAFLRLVQLRRSKGALRASQAMTGGPSVIESVPSEVWDIMRHKVVDLELRDAEVEHVRSLVCTECVPVLDPNTTWSRVAQLCRHVWYMCEGLNSGKLEGVADDLLKVYGLVVPTYMPILAKGPPYASAGGFTKAWSDPNTATVIALPAHACTGGRELGLYVQCGGPEYDDQQAIVDVSHQVPRDTTARFRRLVSDLHLQPVIITDGVLANAETHAVEGKAKLRLDEREYKEIPLDEVKPGWKFITMADSAW
ncbi:hypothetical protein JCM10450v2_001307 [Rhodotorula kratochvilovae]